MLERLLEHLVSEEVLTLEDLAQRLEVSDGLLEQMLHDLERGGYLERVAMACEGHCAECEESPLCGLVQGKRIWRVTEKGFRLVGRQRPAASA